MLPSRDLRHAGIRRVAFVAHVSTKATGFPTPLLFFALRGAYGV